MFKISSLIFTMCFVFYIGWIVVSTDPHQRLDRACRPVNWTGNIVLSMAAFVAPSSQSTVDAAFKKGDYACQYSLWRLLYEDDWKKSNAASGRG